MVDDRDSRPAIPDRGENQGTPFQISTSASDRPIRAECFGDCGTREDAVAATSTDHAVAVAAGSGGRPAAADVRWTMSSPAAAHRRMNSSAWTSDPPASASSRSRHASTWIERVPAASRSAARSSMADTAGNVSLTCRHRDLEPAVTVPARPPRRGVQRATARRGPAPVAGRAARRDGGVRRATDRRAALADARRDHRRRRRRRRCRAPRRGRRVARLLAGRPLPVVGDYVRSVRSLCYTYVWETWPATAADGAAR